MTTSIAPYQPMTPDEFDADVTAAHRKARTLTTLAEAQKLYTQIGAGKHLRVEGWLTIGRAYGYTTGTGETTLLQDAAGAFYGVKAIAYVYDGNGIRVGQAESYCTKDEENWSDKPVAQMAGMAQTRAVSRALRQLLSWVVVLAGYSATPAEEMMAARVRTGDIVADPLLCPIHKVKWFKTGKMRGYSHPIGTEKPAKSWCNMDDVRRTVDVGGDQETPVVPTEEDLGFGEEPEPLSPDAPQRPQEPRNDVPAPRKPFPVQGEKETAFNYMERVAQEVYGKSRDQMLKAIGGNWPAWEVKHKTPQAAVQAAIGTLELKAEE